MDLPAFNRASSPKRTYPDRSRNALPSWDLVHGRRHSRVARQRDSQALDPGPCPKTEQTSVRSAHQNVNHSDRHGVIRGIQRGTATRNASYFLPNVCSSMGSSYATTKTWKESQSSAP